MIRKFFRFSKVLARLFFLLGRFFPQKKISEYFCSLYLQSEAERPELKYFIEWYLKNLDASTIKKSISLSKSALIKAHTESEKGVILVGFEHELEELISSNYFRSNYENYYVLFMPTWQPFYSLPLLKAVALLGQRLIVLPSSQGCFYRALQLKDLFGVMPFHASSWINEDLYIPKEKNIDILMVANFSTYKRHKLLFEAIPNLPKDMKIVLVGRPVGSRTADKLLAEAKEYGVENRFDLIQGASDEDIIDYLSRAKLVLGLSGREGSYVSLAEALFADAAVAVFVDAFIGTKDYINTKTGFLLQHDTPLSNQIKTLIPLIEITSPREWAVSNISASKNNNRLNALLKSYLSGLGDAWFSDCQKFYIQSFEIYPEIGKWSLDIEKGVNEFMANGVNFKTQLKRIK